MEHRRIDELARVADISPAAVPALPVLATRKERLARWADLLERSRYTMYGSLPEVEFEPRARRRGLRRGDSSIALAFSDPVLRSNGLKGDTFGDARDFFRLSQHELHEIVCTCAHGNYASGSEIAESIREVQSWTATARRVILSTVVTVAAGACLYGGLWLVGLI